MARELFPAARIHRCYGLTEAIRVAMIASDVAQRAIAAQALSGDNKEDLRIAMFQALAESGGYFIQPTVFRDVRNDMKIAREEIFGPVIGLTSAESLDDAIDLTWEEFLNPGP